MENWLSAHLHFHFGIFSSSFDNLLLALVRNCVEECKKNSWIKNFFFIRYGAKGPHVRLRLLLNEDIEQQCVKSYLEEMVTDYALDNPAPTPFFQSQSIWMPQWARHGEILYIPYEPEIQRYGGLSALRVVEQQFQDSSFFAWDILNQGRERRFELAFKMFLEAIAVFFPEKQALSAFLGNNIRALLDAEAGYVASSLWKEDSKLHKFLTEEYNNKTQPPVVKIMLKAYQSRVHDLQPNIIQAYKKFWNRLQNENGTHDTPWTESLASIRVTLLKLKQKSDLIVAKDRQINESQQVLTILASMLHMHHNRLGLHLTDECWLSFLALHIIAPEDLTYLFDQTSSYAFK
jgi:hypothetical protein